MMSRDLLSEDMAKRPEWLDGESEIIAILNAFLDKLDQKPISARARIPSIRIDKKVAPALHNNDEAADRTWALLRSLEGLVFEIRPNRKRQPYDPEYLGASLRFLDSAEEVCRRWLGRPRLAKYQEEWRAVVEDQAAAFVDGGASLLARPVKVPGKSAQQVVEAFVQVGGLSNSKLTLRQISARYFWGHSKLLDSREDLLSQLYPDLRVAARPVLVHAYVPPSFQGVLFIENQDTYLQSLAGNIAESEGLALVYVAGFRASAERARNRGSVSLHYQAKADRNAQAVFERWWFNDSGTSAEEYPVWFWGDLDYSGMSILKVLRNRFDDLHAWEPGYAPMLEVLRAGGGHFAEIADKAEQIDPGDTGCCYADQLLLPVIREMGRFVDQEAV